MKIDFFNCQIFIDSKDFPKVSKTPPIDVEEMIFKIMWGEGENKITEDQIYYGKPLLSEEQKSLIHSILINIEMDM